jgi:transposase InsO family protein
MGGRRSAYDNAVCESFFKTLRSDLIDRRSWPDKAELRTAVFDYIECFYNRQRRHSSLDYLSPTEYERINPRRTSGPTNPCPPNRGNSILRPGHRVTRDRSQRSRDWMKPETRVGYDFAHAIVDDHSRLAYVELHDDEKAATVTGFLERALVYFAAHGISVKRLMTDNGFSYVKNRSLRELLAREGIRHITTQPYRPRTNGKVERFHQTMGREWAYGLAYRSHHDRNQALPHWLDHYNRQRPHSSLGDQPPISRVHNVRG